MHEMERRFNDEETVPLLQSIGACHPDSSNFLDIDTVRPLVYAYKPDETGTLSSQIDVYKLLINRSADKPSGTSDLIAFLNPAEGFPDLRRLLQLALTVP